MAEDSSDILKYDYDPRTPCRYGLNCYQINSAHHEKFKHPPKRKCDKKQIESTDNLSSSDTNSGEKLNNTDKKRNKNLLTSWLNSPRTKKQKVHDSFHNRNEKVKNQEPCCSSNDTSKNNSHNVTKNQETNDSQNQIKETVKSNDIDESVSGKNNSQSSNSQLDDQVKKGVKMINITPLDMDDKTKIKKFFLVDMPNDFYQFWSFCESTGCSLLVKGNPSDALKSVGLTLVGPYDVLAKKFDDNVIYDQAALLRHYRYYYDVPEFQTIIKGDKKTGFHMGYFRDDPKENPVFVASNSAEKDGIIKSVAENIFGAVNVYLDDYKKTADPFAKSKINKLQNALTSWANKEHITLSKSTVDMKKREASVVTRTFHKAGLVVPYNKKTELGYRELAEDNATIKRILSNIVDSADENERKQYFSKLFPIINYANIANDECDFGTSLELGLDLFTFGSPLLHETAKRLMVTSYNLLGRHEFAEILEAHLRDRKKGSDLSIL